MPPRSFKTPDPPRRPPIFWWVMANALAGCFAVLAWVGCLYVFNQPELPWNYDLLYKLGRIEPLERFTALDAPRGSAADPPALYRKYFALDEETTELLNKELLRNYMGNFENPVLNTYVTGEYRVVSARPLEPGEFFHPGFVVRARAYVQPDEFRSPGPYPVMIDYLFPTAEAEVASKFRPGDVLEISKIPNCASVLHSARTGDDLEPVVHLTVVPIAYGNYQAPDGSTFAIEPPDRIQPGTEFPLQQRSGEADVADPS